MVNSIAHANSSVMPFFVEQLNLNLSFEAIGILSTAVLSQQGHLLSVDKFVREDAHQKHSLQIKNCAFDMRILPCRPLINMD